MHVIVRRRDVEKANIEPTLKVLRALEADSETTHRCQNSVTLSLQGFDDDPRGVFEIQEVRKFVKELNTKWFSWFFFMTKEVDISPLAAILLCLCRYTKSPFGLFIPDCDDSKWFMRNFFGALNALCEIHNLSKEQNEASIQHVAEYFMRVGFVEGCDLPRLPVESAKTGTVLRNITYDTD